MAVQQSSPANDAGSIAKELIGVTLIVAALSVQMVGLVIKDVPGGVALEGRFADVLAAVIIAVLGRIWQILLRYDRRVPVMLMSGGVTIALIAMLLGETLFGAATGQSIKRVLPFNSPIVHWLLVVLAAFFFMRAALARYHADTGGVAAGPSVMDRVSASVSRNSIFIWVILITFAVIFPFTPLANLKSMSDAILILTYVMLGWGLNIVVGLAGLLDLGYVAFYAVGAYAYALLATEFGVSFWLCLPFAGLMAASAGVILGFPVLRLRGDYLAIVTLGFGEMIRVVLLNWYSLTKGPDGIKGIQPPPIFGYSLATTLNDDLERSTEFHTAMGWVYSDLHVPTFLFYLILIMALVTNLFTMRIRRLPVGRAWEALREDEIACRSLGMNPTNTKLTAFGIGAMFAGFAGSFFATRQGFISPESFTFIESAVILAIVVLGGFGSQIGIVVAAFILIGFPEFFRELKDYRMLFFGLSMVLIMLWRPRGLLAHREPTIRLHPKDYHPPEAQPDAPAPANTPEGVRP